MSAKPYDQARAEACVDAYGLAKFMSGERDGAFLFSIEKDAAVLAVKGPMKDVLVQLVEQWIPRARPIDGIGYV
ncbi:MAG: hypothetical protein KGL35_06475 [Bradyrhizobium sp.]|nr:hypothetical protein [Bradyrhizobium sp.]